MLCCTYLSIGLLDGAECPLTRFQITFVDVALLEVFVQFLYILAVPHAK